MQEMTRRKYVGEDARLSGRSMRAISLKIARNEDVVDE